MSTYPTCRSWAPFPFAAAATVPQPLAAAHAVPVVPLSSTSGLLLSAEAVQAQLSEIASGLLGGVEVPPDQPLMEAGLDSIGERDQVLLPAASPCCCVAMNSSSTPLPSPSPGSVELRNAVGARFGIELPTTGTEIALAVLSTRHPLDKPQLLMRFQPFSPNPLQ